MGVDEGPEGQQPVEERGQARRRVGRLELDALGQDRLRPVDLVDQSDEVHAQVVPLVPQLADHPQHVVGDPFLDRQPVDRDRDEVVEGPIPEGAGGGAPGRGRVVEAVVPALVPVDGGEERVLLEVRLPEAVGKLVDGFGVWRGGHGERGDRFLQEAGDCAAGHGGEPVAAARRAAGHGVGRAAARGAAQARTASRRMRSGSFPWRRTSSWKRRMSKASPSRAARSVRSRWISRRPVM